MWATVDTDEIFRSLLVCLGVVLVLGKTAAVVCRRLGQPVVIGEILVGIALGPSLLGQLPGDLDRRLFSEGTLPFLEVVARVGMVLFMFVVGLEVDMAVVRRSGKRALAISLSSIALPFALGFLVLSNLLYSVGAPRDAVGERADFLPFAFFMGLAICGTAFAVLARILAERNMFKIQIGSLLIACAAIDDVVAFSLLAIGVALAEGGEISGILVVMSLLVVFVGFLRVVVRPIMDRLVTRHYRRTRRLEPQHLGYVFIGLVLSSFTTSVFGLHELIGAFFFGLLFPRDGLPDFMNAMADRVEGISVHLFLPVFFVVAGQGVSIDGMTATDLGFTSIVVVVAMLGKFVGGSVASRSTGVGTRQSLAIGALMNTRGLAELVILQIARSAGVINDRVYTMFVITAIVTTVLSGPLLRLVYPDRWLQRDIAEEERNASSARDRFVVVLPSEERNRESVLSTSLMSQRTIANTSITLVAMTTGELDLDAMAVSFAVVKDVERRFHAAGISVNVITRHTNAPDADLLDIIESSVPHVVVQHGLSDEMVSRIRQIGPDVVEPDPDLNEDDFARGVKATDNDAATVEFALRLALGSETGILVHDETRRQATARRRLGLPPPSNDPVIVGHGDSATVRVLGGQRAHARLIDVIDTWRSDQVAINPLVS